MDTDRQHALESIDLNLMLNSEEKFLPAVMLLCNELKARFNAAQVSLGWVKNNHIDLIAISNAQRFNQNDEVLRRLRYAMEESADQSDEVIVPAPEGEHYIQREHETYLRLSSMGSCASIPIRLEHEVIAVITLERTDTPFEEEEIKSLRLICDLAARRLHDLEWKSKNIFRKCKHGLSKLASLVFGVEHTWMKVGFVAAIIILAVLLFWPWHYRVEAPFQLKTETVLHLPAPFDGFISDVKVKLGDQVEKDEILLTLDNRELLLQEAESEAKIKGHESDAKRARSEGKLTDSNLSLLMAREETERLKLTQFKIEKSVISAPEEGFIIEGDLKEMIGSPVRTGDPLFKFSKLNDLYLRLEIAEDEIHEVIENAGGEFAFTSRPELRYKFTIESLVPSAISQSEGSVFYARCRFENDPENWWRPGMNGVAKIDVGNRSILWVLTHRLVDFIRMKLWI